MAEYIERDALEEAFDAVTMAFLEKEDHLFDRKSVLAGISVAAGIVHTVPAADVAPVVHGRWVNEDFPENLATVHDMAQCSVCGELSHKAEHGYAILSKFCPNCGAKMEKEDH